MKMNENFAILHLIHYGANQYDPKKFLPISDVPFCNKPKGGLWTSPVDSKYGWRNWCEDESFGDTTKSFEVGFKGTVFVIDSIRDMNKLPWIEWEGVYFVSFQALCAIGFMYDAVHLTEKGQHETRLTYPRSLSGWDCESVFVMNPDTVSICT